MANVLSFVARNWANNTGIVNDNGKLKEFTARVILKYADKPDTVVDMVYSNYNDIDVEGATEVIVEATPNRGYIITGAYLTNIGSPVEFTPYQFTRPVAPARLAAGSPWTWRAYAILTAVDPNPPEPEPEPEPTPDYVITQADFDLLTNNQITIYNGEIPLVVGSELYYGDLLTANIQGMNLINILRFVYTDTVGQKYYHPFIISEDKKSASLTFAEVYTGKKYNSIQSTVTDGANYRLKSADITTLTNNNATLLINGVAGVLDTPIMWGDNLVLNINNPDKKLVYARFRGADSVGQSRYLNFNIDSGLQSASLTFASPPTAPYTYTALQISLADLYDYVITQNDLDQFNSSYATVTVDDVPVYLGMGIVNGQTIKATLPRNREFNMINIGAYNLSSIYFTAKDSAGQAKYLGFTLSDENKTATLVLSSPDNPAKWTSIVSVSSEVTLVTGNNSVYLIDDAKLTEIVAQRFSLVGEGEVFDYGVFILGLISIPFKLPDGIVLESSPISLGNKTLTTSAPEIVTDNIAFNLGDIYTPKENNNYLDYMNTTAILHLPRTPPINLDINYVLGHTINIEMIVEVYSGKANINIRSDKTGEIFATNTVDIGVNVPYIGSIGTPRAENVSITLGGINDVLTPFIEIIRNDSYNADGVFNIPVKDESVLLGNTGFIKVNEIDLNVSATTNEKDAILNMLKTGVIIK